MTRIDHPCGRGVPRPYVRGDIHRPGKEAGRPASYALLLSLTLFVAACSSPPSGVKAIVGAKLDAIEYSVVVIENGKIRAVGSQADVPVPKGSEITSGLGKTIAPIASPIDPGQPAELVLRDRATGAVRATMHKGEWDR